MSKNPAIDTWPSHVTDILGGDQAVAFAYCTPAGGTVLVPVTTLGEHDADARTVTTTTSFGNWKKLTRIERNDRVAFAFHTRTHGHASAPHYLLVQGRASFPDRPDSAPRPDASALAARGRFVPAEKRGPIWRRLAHEYQDLRVPITVEVERIVAWPDETASGQPEVLGTPRPVDLPLPQRAPTNGVEPRVKASSYARRLRRSRHHLLGYVGADGYPVVLPAGLTMSGDHLVLDTPEPVPAERRAGFLAHWFEPRLVGQGTVILTGWLDRHDGTTRFAPHTSAGYEVPANRFVMSLGGAITAKVGYRAAERAGHVRDGSWQRCRVAPVGYEHA